MFTLSWVFRIALVAALSIPAPLLLTEARSDENLWGYLYGTDTLPKGGTEIYNWLTLRTGKG